MEMVKKVVTVLSSNVRAWLNSQNLEGEKGFERALALPTYLLQSRKNEARGHEALGRFLSERGLMLPRVLLLPGQRQYEQLQEALSCATRIENYVTMDSPFTIESDIQFMKERTLLLHLSLELNREGGIGTYCRMT